MKMRRILAAVAACAVAATMAVSASAYDAFLMGADAGWSWGSGNWNAVADGGVGTDADVTGNGTYTVSLTSEQVGAEAAGFGFVVFNVDIVGFADALGCGTKDVDGLETAADKMQYAKDAGLSITDVSIALDGETVYTYDDADVLFGDIEANGNIRIELYNEYGESKTSAPQGVKDLAGEAEYDEVAVTFTVAIAEKEEEPKDDNAPTGASAGLALAGLALAGAAVVATKKNK